MCCDKGNGGELGAIGRRLKKVLLNLPGWRSSRRIVVFVSDDWGSVRTPSAESLTRLRELGVKVDDCHYMQFDRLESGDDLEGLFNLLEMYKDNRGRTPVFTANCLTANPDFDRIRLSDYSDYFAEPITLSYAAVKGAEHNMAIWKEATRRGICLPQSHGREHLNVSRWMADLQSNDAVARAAFDYGMFGVSAHTTNPRRASYLAAFDAEEDGAAEDTRRTTATALEEFRAIFGLESRSFIAPNYVWGAAVESTSKEHGVDYMQSGAVQWLPGHGKTRRRRHFQGGTNSFGQRYVVRNVHFEPSSDRHKDWVGEAMRDIDLAFRLRKPAVISTHRVNFVGGLSTENRDRGLSFLKNLLSDMLKRWPDIEFLDAVELGDAMSAAGART